MESFAIPFVEKFLVQVLVFVTQLEIVGLPPWCLYIGIALGVLSFTPYSNLYGLFNRLVVDKDEISATACTCYLVAFDLVLVFVNGSLYV